VETAERRCIFRKSHTERGGRKVFKAEIENHRNKRRESQYDSLFELRTNKKFTEFVASDRDAGGFPERLIRPMVGSSFFHLSGLTGRENKRFDSLSEVPFDRKTWFQSANRVTHFTPIFCI